jgi:mannose/cellobiose epimerase-like protein (N-acyl-D-glucosamine 2-epimerase family)
MPKLALDLDRSSVPAAGERQPDCFDRVRSWLFDIALPFWAIHGVDKKQGGFVEQLTFEGANRHVGFKRTRVIGRQIYVFSHAAILGQDFALPIARSGYEFLKQNAWTGPNRGWARQLQPDGTVKDATPDLYDLAFVLFALGWYYRASKDPDVLLWAIRTLDFINSRMRHPSGRGFLTEVPPIGPRMQNPHMHLLEAALVNFEATRDTRFLALADEIVQLFQDFFFDEVSSTLGEYFNEDWTRLDGIAGRTVEPGHQFEWAWILSSYQRITGRNTAHYVKALIRFAEDHGVCPHNSLTFNTVRDDGEVMDAGSRVWPNTERMKAAVANFELVGKDPRSVFESCVGVLFQRFLIRDPAAIWIDRLDADGRVAVDHVPTSTLYHVILAFTEMLRIEPEVKKKFVSYSVM